MSDEQKIQIIEIAELPKVIHAYESGDGRGWDENAWAHPISCTIAEYHRVDVAPFPAINQASDPYQVYLEVANSCADPWDKTSMRNNAARFKEALKKHAAAVKRGDHD